MTTITGPDTPRTIAEKLVARHCADWPDTNRASLIKAIETAIENYGEDEYQRGLADADGD